MPSDWQPNRIEQRAKDALDAIATIKKYKGNKTSEEFVADSLLQDGIIRQILVLSEACTRLKELQDKNSIPYEETFFGRHEDIPYSKIYGIGNLIRHGYGKIVAAEVWEAITDQSLPDLEKSLKEAFPLL